MSAVLPCTDVIAVKYNVGVDNYVQFVTDLRDKAKDGAKKSHKRPILPSESDSSPPFIAVELRVFGLFKGTVTIRRFDLRLMNYSDPDGNQIDVSNLQLYDDGSSIMVSALEGLHVGLDDLIKAINSLATLEGDLKLCLALLCLVFCEAAKLDILCNIFDKAFKFGYRISVCSWMLTLMKKWGDISQELMCPDIHNHPETEDIDDLYIPSYDNGWHDDERWLVGVTCQDIARYVGVFRAYCPPSVESMDCDDTLGYRLAEIFSVSVCMKRGRPRSVFGTVIVDFGSDSYYLYKRGVDDAESIEPHDTISLQGPKDYIPWRRHICIYVDLKLSDGSYVSKGVVVYGSLPRDDFTDSRLSCMVRGEAGYAIVHFSVFEQACIANVEATLVVVKGGGADSSHVCVCGSVLARYDWFSYATAKHKKYYQTRLFNKPVECTLESGKGKEAESVEVGGAPMKLSRSLVAVAVQGSLVIEANLTSCDGKPILVGSCSWVPRMKGESMKIISDEIGNYILQVKVTWGKRS